MRTNLLFITAIQALFWLGPLLRADDSALPRPGFPASRYETLWTKSPFAVETSEVTTESSPDYQLVGIATIEGISYASLIERQSQEHFLVSSDKPTRGLLLTSVHRGHAGSDTTVVVQKDGQPITLKLEESAVVASAPNAPPQPAPPMPQAATGSYPLNIPPGARPPFTRIHRPPIRIPPPPQTQPTP